MRWQDEGLLLSIARYGEGSARLSLLTREHGLWNGLARSQARGKCLASFPPLGTRLSVAWSARLESHLGHFRIEQLDARAARLFDVPIALLALQSLCALAAQTMPEREPCLEFYNEIIALIEAIDSSEKWFAQYLRWENSLLSTCGFSLDLSRCCTSGSVRDLAFLSPRTGRAISRTALNSPQVAPYRDRLLKLPAVLLNGSKPSETISRKSWCEGLQVLGYFIGKFVGPLPSARERLLELSQSSAQSSAKNLAQSAMQPSSDLSQHSTRQQADATNDSHALPRRHQ